MVLVVAVAGDCSDAEDDEDNVDVEVERTEPRAAAWRLRTSVESW